MATEVNPFDQFDTPDPNATPLPPGTMPGTITIHPSAEPNPFDQFDASPKYDPRVNVNALNGIPSTTPVPKRELTWYEALKGMAQGTPQGAVDFLRSAWHAGTHPAESAVKLANMIGGAGVKLDKSIGGTFLNQLTPDVRKMIEQDHPEIVKAVSGDAVTIENMYNAANAVGDLYRHRYGSVAEFKQFIHDHPYEFYADAASLLAAPGISNLGRAGLAAIPGRAGQVARATQAVGQAALAPTQTVNRLAEAAADAAPRVGRYVEDVTHPTNAFVRRTTEDAVRPGSAERVLDAIDDARMPVPVPPGSPPRIAGEIVQGSRPTPAQVVAEMPGAPAPFQAAAKAADELNPTAALGIKDTQNAARLAGIDTIGGNTASNVLERQRALDAARNYADAGVTSTDPALARMFPARSVMVSADPALVSLLERQRVGEVFDRARVGADTQGRPFQVGTNAPGRWVPDPYGQHLPPMWEPPTFAQYSAQDLHRVKQAFDDEAFDVGSRFGIDSAEARDIQGARDEFIRWFESHNDPYRNARQTYADQSRPIDRKKIGEMMRSELTGTLLDDDALDLRAQNFANKIDNPLNDERFNASIKRATGQQRYRLMSEILTPQEMQMLQGVRDDLGRQVIANAQAKAAGRFKGSLETAVSDALGVKPTNKVANFFLRRLNEGVADRVGPQLQTLEGADELVNNYLARQGQIDDYAQVYGMGRRVNQMLNPYRYVNRYPTVLNAMNAGRKDDTPPQ